MALVWMPAFPFFAFSVVILIIRLFKLLISPDKKLVIKLIRPILVIVIWIFATHSHKISKSQAHIQSLEIAQYIQAQCDKEGQCPESIEGLGLHEPKSGNKYYTAYIRKRRINYYFEYAISGDGKSFMIDIDHGFNMGTKITGGVDKELTAIYFDEDYETDLITNKKNRKEYY